MSLLVLALLAACGGGSNCQRYCGDLSGFYPSLVSGSGQDAAGLPGFGKDGSFDAASYQAECANAPSTRSCEECSGWYSETFLAPIAVTDSCDEAYGRAGAGVQEARAAECEQTCDDEGLRY